MDFRKLALLPIAAVSIACSSKATGDLASKTSTTLSVSSDAFEAGQAIPSQYSAQGGNRSPAITWTPTPAGTKSIAVIVDDVDADGYVHWVIFNISPDMTTLPAESSSLGQWIQGRNSHGELGYYGPQPPPGGAHHYHFHVYALDGTLPLKTGASREDVVEAMSNHVLAQGELVGVFQSG